MKREVEPAQIRGDLVIKLIGVAACISVAFTTGMIFMHERTPVIEVGPKTPPTIRVAPNVRMLGGVSAEAGDVTFFTGDVVISGSLTVLNGEDDDER